MNHSHALWLGTGIKPTPFHSYSVFSQSLILGHLTAYNFMLHRTLPINQLNTLLFKDIQTITQESDK
jgi:hypothetical protein